MDELTTAQIMFITLAGMEDARIKAGGGIVERSGRGQNSERMSVSDYAKMRRGADLSKQIKETRKAQKPFRDWLESQVKDAFDREMRFR